MNPPSSVLPPSTLVFIEQRVSLHETLAKGWRRVPLGCEIALVAYEDHGNGIATCVVENLVADDGAHLERRPARDRVDEHPTVQADCMLRAQDAELVLKHESALTSAPRLLNSKGTRTCPAVSTISRTNSLPLYLTVFEKVFSIVG